MNIEPEFLTIDDVLDIHQRQLARFGGSGGIRDLGLLESAVAMPQASFGGEWLHAGLFKMAAAYAFHIAENQPFIDGNKRAGLLSALVFLDINGITIDYPDDRLHQAMINIAEKKSDKKALAALLKDIFLQKK
jgi:death on curing protein